MKIFIEEYRGFTIEFDKDNERFSCSLDDKKCNEKQSYSSAKKWIDEYLKDNYKFEPFEITFTRDGEVKRATVIGIRKDGRFVSEVNGKKDQISEYDEGNWFLCKDENEVHLATIVSLESQIDDLKKEIKRYEDKLNKETLKSIKPKYLQP